jgi:hypothetical protein
MSNELARKASNFSTELLDRLAAMDRLEGFGEGQRAAALLSRFQHVNLSGQWRLRRVPALADLPSGWRFRLLVDNELRAPTDWSEVRSNWSLAGDGEPVDLQQGDCILAPEREPASAKRSRRLGQHSTTAGCFDSTIAAVNKWRVESVAARHAAGRGGAACEADRLSGVIQELNDATTVLTLAASCDMNAIEKVTEIPFYSAGYYDMHVAVDHGTNDRARWQELRDDGELVALGTVKPDCFDLFSGYFLLRPAKPPSPTLQITLESLTHPAGTVVREI